MLTHLDSQGHANMAEVTALTLNDMCKAMDRGMRIEPVCLLEKPGGKSGHYLLQDQGAGEA